MFRLQVTITAISFGIAPVMAQSSDPAWLDDLTFDARTQEKCEIAYIVRMQEGELGSESTYEARIQCEDGRMFDASRVDSSAIFTFKACEMQVC